MSDSPTVSVLVTVYNREKYLRDCIQSILNSSFTDFEVIVVDDCSQDGSLALARELALADQRVRVFANESNLGDYGNRREAASKARGRYLKYVDADDLIYAHSLGVMVQAMEQFPDAALALSINQSDPPTPFPFCTSARETTRLHFLGKSLYGVGPSAAIIRTDAFWEVGGFSGRQFIGDTELWYKLGERWPLVSLQPALVWWRQHEDQQMRLEQSTFKVLNKRFKLELESLEGTAHLDAAEKASVRALIKQVHARRILSLAIRHRAWRAAWQTFSESGLTAVELLNGFKGYR